jgi:hypothetical protein
MCLHWEGFLSSTHDVIMDFGETLNEGLCGVFQVVIWEEDFIHRSMNK